MSSRMKRTYKPGETALDSGQFILRGSRGAYHDLEITVPQGKTIPATPRPGMTYYLKDVTRHKKYSNG